MSFTPSRKQRELLDTLREKVAEGEAILEQQRTATTWLKNAATAYQEVEPLDAEEFGKITQGIDNGTAHLEEQVDEVRQMLAVGERGDNPFEGNFMMELAWKLAGVHDGPEDEDTEEVPAPEEELDDVPF